jgi:hypothetical protein
LMEVGEARIMWNEIVHEIRILFIIYSLNFPSRLDARACRLEFRTWKGIRLMSGSRKSNGRKRNKREKLLSL